MKETETVRKRQSFQCCCCCSVRRALVRHGAAALDNFQIHSKKKKTGRKKFSTSFMCCEPITCLHKADSDTASRPTGSIHCSSHTYIRVTIHKHEHRKVDMDASTHLFSHSSTKKSPKVTNEKENKQEYKIKENYLDSL